MTHECANPDPTQSHVAPHLDGLINLHKPTGITSAKALYRVRSITKVRKSGHAGTLDPGASGVLVESIMDQPKVYRATARLDVTSESFDADRPLTPVAVAGIPALAAIEQALHSFEGTIEQVPPAISAVKVGGVPAYKRARQDRPVELAARPVEVYWLHLHHYDWPNLNFEMACGRGTYVRALIRDLAIRLHTGGCLTSLVRTRIGPFTVENGWTFDALAAAGGPEEYLIGIEEARQMLEPREKTIPPRPDRARSSGIR